MFKKFILVVLMTLPGVYLLYRQPSNLPVIAIANYGPHESLEMTIKGIKLELESSGFLENKNIRYEIMDVGFDPNLIPKMLLGLKSKSPKVMVVMTTPVAQMAHQMIKDVPLVFSVVTDPKKAGLTSDHKSISMPGSSDRQDFDSVLDFIVSVIPDAHRIGVMYAPSEGNDVAMINHLKKSSLKKNIDVVSLPVDHSRDVQGRVYQLKNKVDAIYVGPSGPIQPALPAIAKAANQLKIPVINFNHQAVRDHLVFGSIGVDYLSVGRNTGRLIVQKLRNQKHPIQVYYPSKHQHFGLINEKIAKQLKISIPQSINKVSV